MRALLLMLLPVIAARADTPPLLAEALARWEQERHRWAFTQHVRESDGRGLVTERVERYDPSRGLAQRWQLIEINGRRPTPAEEQALERRKNRPPRHSPKPISSHVDLTKARVVEEDANRVSYDVPLRSGADWLVPTGRIELVVTLNKQTRSMERARVEIDGPFRVALGLARVIELDLDLALPPAADEGQPEGTAQAVVNRFGRRIEYTWTDFTRGPPGPGSAPR